MPTVKQPHHQSSWSPGDWPPHILERMNRRHLHDLQANCFRPASFTFKPDRRPVYPDGSSRSYGGSPSGIGIDEAGETK